MTHNICALFSGFADRLWQNFAPLWNCVHFVDNKYDCCCIEERGTHHDGREMGSVLSRTFECLYSYYHYSTPCVLFWKSFHIIIVCCCCSISRQEEPPFKPRKWFPWLIEFSSHFDPIPLLCIVVAQRMMSDSILVLARQTLHIKWPLSSFHPQSFELWYRVVSDISLFCFSPPKHVHSKILPSMAFPYSSNVVHHPIAVFAFWYLCINTLRWDSFIADCPDKFKRSFHSNIIWSFERKIIQQTFEIVPYNLVGPIFLLRGAPYVIFFFHFWIPTSSTCQEFLHRLKSPLILLLPTLNCNCRISTCNVVAAHTPHTYISYILYMSVLAQTSSYLLHVKSFSPEDF